MIGWLSGSDVTVVAGQAIVDNTRMAEYCAGKGNGAEVAIDAILVIGSGRYVINGLARTDYIIVAGRAVHGDTRMVIGARGKRARGMANTAIQCSRHVGI